MPGYEAGVVASSGFQNTTNEDVTPHVFFEGDNLAYAGQNLQGIPLRRTKAQAVADG